MTDEIDMQGCERCAAELPIERMSMMDDCWFCPSCVADFRKQFDACEHQWEPHTDTMGDEGQYCSKCCGFVARATGSETREG
jgi:hypothetical protein